MRRSEDQTWVSPDTGLSYNVHTDTIEDACRDCGAKGYIEYSTFADYRRFILDERARNDDPDYNAEDEDYYHTPDTTGLRFCDRCKGTGHFKGDEGVFRVHVTANAQLMMLPQG